MNLYIKKIFVIIPLVLTAASCQHKSATVINSVQESTWVAQATVSNPSNFKRTQEPLYFSYYNLGINSNNNNINSLVATHSKQALRHQHIDSTGDGSKDGIQISIDLEAGDSQDINFTYNSNLAKKTWPKLTQAEISHKDGGKWVEHSKTKGMKAYEGGHFINVNELTPPNYYTDHSNWIRYEGPGIESDKVAYRIYLDWRNGFDIFGKSTSKPALHLIGQDGYDSYHEKQPWGMDILKVGKSLGSGGFGTWNGESIDIVSDVKSHTAKILENGVNYSSLSIQYTDWKTNNKTINLNAQFSMVAGSRLVHTQLKPSEPLPNFAIGVVKHKETEFIQGSFNIPGDSYTYIGSWGQQTLNDDMLGMAVIFRKRDLNKVVIDKNSYASVMKGESGELDYYFTAAWQGEHNSGITTKEAFIQYLEMEIEKLTLAPRIVLKTARSEHKKKRPISAKSALNWSILLADSELDRKTLQYHVNGWDTNRKRKPKFEYDIIGLQPMAYYELGKVTGKAKYTDIIETSTASYIKDNGEIQRYKESNYNIDAVAPGRALLRLIQDTGEEKYKIAATQLRRQLKNQPRTSEGAFWHKKKYEWQLWLDGVYMGTPFLAEYSAMFEDGSSFEEVVKEFVITRKHLRDSNTGLYYHAWDEKKKQPWANSETGLSEQFWARGMGWLTMGIVDVLDYIPVSEKALREPLLNMVQEIAEALVKYQDPKTGTWWQIMDKAGKRGNYRESTATAMFSYFLSKSVRLGYLPESYKKIAKKSYSGLINEFVLVHDNGQISMTQQCYVAGLGFGRDGSYHYYMSEQIYNNDPKGNGPFILAGIEMHRLLK